MYVTVGLIDKHTDGGVNATANTLPLFIPALITLPVQSPTKTTQPHTLDNVNAGVHAVCHHTDQSAP